MNKQDVSSRENQLIDSGSDDLPIRNVLRHLGPLPATFARYPSGKSVSGIGEEFVRRWVTDPDSHLLVVSGSYGSGKTHMLGQIAAGSKSIKVIDYAAEELPSATEIGSSECLLVDHFDEVAGFAAVQKNAPDLRVVARHLKQRKVCIVTNRPLTDKSHELVRQLRYSTRLEALGVKNLEILSLETWSVAAVQASVEKYLPEAKRHLTNLTASKDVDLSSLLKPMVLRMLLSILAQQPEHWIPEYGEIYDLYLEHTLSWDYDQGRSQINSLDKRALLTSLAYSLFTGKDRSSRRPGVVSTKVVGDKIKELGCAARDDAAGNPLQDFLSTNRCLELAGGGSDRSSDEWKFESKTVFEYFLADALVSRYVDGISIGLKEADFNPSILDTRMLYFARRALSRSSPDAIFTQLRTKELSAVDRLILLYLIEDLPEFTSLLSSSPETYFSHLATISEKIDYHFMVKIARFQLVSSGRMSASEYLDFIQLSEEPSHLEVELQICRTPTGNIHYLESRFQNPSLLNSSAISIYRIAQIDPAKAKQLLEEQTSLSELQLKECKDAFSRALESNSRRLRPVV